MSDTTESSASEAHTPDEAPPPDPAFMMGCCFMAQYAINSGGSPSDVVSSLLSAAVLVTSENIDDPEAMFSASAKQQFLHRVGEIYDGIMFEIAERNGG